MSLAADPTQSTVGPRWRTYPAYRDSGVGWLGEVPVTWEMNRLKYLAPASSVKLAEKHPDAPYVGLENIESRTGKLMLDAPLESVESTVSVFERGDVLFGKLRPYLAKVAVPGFPGTCSTELLVLRPANTMDGRFLLYRLLSPDIIELVNSLTYGAKMPRASGEQVASLAIAVPSPAEQRSIVAFLDRETAKIDALVAKKQRLVELLQEKRAALISHAVTKGLDPAVPTKDSGVEWLGEIPSHWQVKGLKHVTSLVTSGSRGWAQYYSDDGAVFLRIGNLSRISIDPDLSDIQHVSPPSTAEGARARAHAGDVVVSITAYIGAVAEVSETIPEAYVSQHIALVRPRRHAIAPRWLAYCLSSQVGQYQLGLLLYGGTKDGLGLDDVRNLLVLLPPLDEQSRIIARLDEQTGAIDRLIGRIRRHIDRLKEYRTALISAAVTGKIDVRGEVG